MYGEHVMCIYNTISVRENVFLPVYSEGVCRKRCMFLWQERGGGVGRGDLDTTLSAIYNLCLEENASVGMFSSS